MPIFAIPGNHDAREPMRQAFIGDGYLPPAGVPPLAIEDYPLRTRAQYFGARRGRRGSVFGATAQARSNPLGGAGPAHLVLMHHPPFLTGIRRMDQAGLADSAGFAEIIRRHPQVEQIGLRASSSPDRKPLCRHGHRGPLRAPRIKSSSTSVPRRGSASFSSRRAISSTTGVRGSVSPLIPTAIGRWPGPYFY